MSRPDEIEGLLKALGEVESMDDPGARPLAAPGCLTFVRSQELGLGGAATSEERAHLSACAACRRRVEAFASTASPAEGFRARRTGRRLRLALVSALAVAAALALVLLGPWLGRDELAVRVALAPTAEGLFRTDRGVTDSPEFHVGVSVSRPAHLRLLFVDDLGRVHSQDLSPDGRRSLLVEPDVEQRFGAYARRWTGPGLDRRVAALFVLLTEEPLAEDAVTDALAAAGPLASMDAEALERRAGELRAALGGSVVVRSLED